MRERNGGERVRAIKEGGTVRERRGEEKGG